MVGVLARIFSSWVEADQRHGTAAVGIRRVGDAGVEQPANILRAQP